MRHPKYKDLTGNIYGKLTVISESVEKTKNGETKWNCICECGGKRIATTGNLSHGGVKSCGCMWGNPTHGESKNRIRRIWFGMMARCYKPNSGSWKRYGAVGVTVCEEWKNYFVFKKWALENGYKEPLTLDRFPDIKGNYEPPNCRWATYKTQGRNKGNNRMLEFNGVIKPMSEWAEIHNISQTRVRRRLSMGWSVKEALLTPIDKKYISNRYRKICQ